MKSLRLFLLCIRSPCSFSHASQDEMDDVNDGGTIAIDRGLAAIVRNFTVAYCSQCSPVGTENAIRQELGQDVSVSMNSNPTLLRQFVQMRFSFFRADVSPKIKPSYGDGSFDLFRRTILIGPRCFFRMDLLSVRNREQLNRAFFKLPFDTGDVGHRPWGLR